MGRALDIHQTEIKVNKETEWLTDRTKELLGDQTNGLQNVDGYTER